MSENQVKPQSYSASSSIETDQNSYPFVLWSGILSPHHRKRLGIAIWVFMWCLRRTTVEDNGMGRVLGGSRIKTERIARELGVSARSVHTDLERLKTHDYIKIRRVPYGLVITVLKSKRWLKSKRSEESCRSEIGKILPISNGTSEGSCLSRSEGSFRNNIEKAVRVNREKRENSGSASPHRKSARKPEGPEKNNGHFSEDLYA
jgi:hypothetical protein